MVHRLSKTLKRQIQDIFNKGNISFIELKMKFDIIGINYDSDIDIIDHVYKSIGYYAATGLLKEDNNIDRIFNETLTRKTLYDCWTGGTKYKAPIYRICAQVWLKKHPEFCEN